MTGSSYGRKLLSPVAGRGLAFCALITLSFSPMPVAAQAPYDLLLKRGHVIDPAGEIDRVMDVAVKGNRIARVAAEIPSGQASKTVDVSGLYVTPGLIDIHAHVYGFPGSLFPDDTALLTGVTTVVDCGGAGWRTFEDLKAKIIDRVKTRVLAFLNIVGAGMVSSEAESNVEDMDPQATAGRIREYPDLIVGIKKHDPGPPGWVVLDRAIEAGRLAGKPVIVDDHIYTNSQRNTREKLLDKLRPGDLHTHMFNDQQMEVIGRFSGKIEPYMRAARKRGVLFDVGHGGASFLWPVAVAAMQQGFPPDVISTDLHSSSIMAGQSDMPNCISKFINLGMSLPDAISRSTASPARAIGKFPELGTLGEGRTADIAVFALEAGIFAFKDARAKKLLGTKRLRAVMTIRDGEIVFDEDGIAAPLWDAAEGGESNSF